MESKQSAKKLNKEKKSKENLTAKKDLPTTSTTNLQSTKEQKSTNTAQSNLLSSSYNVLLFPITTEKVISNIETLNQLVFAVKLNSTKKQIKEEFERLFRVKVKKVNTKISPKGIKYAYIKLKEGRADDIAMQLKMI
ncbi:MAG: 50S ribosomal protein L23 [Candidatus Anstonellaceae archaeon]